MDHSHSSLTWQWTVWGCLTSFGVLHHIVLAHLVAAVATGILSQTPVAESALLQGICLLNASGTSLRLRDTAWPAEMPGNYTLGGDTRSQREESRDNAPLLDDNSVRCSLIFQEPGTIKLLLSLTVTLIRPLYASFFPLSQTLCSLISASWNGLPNNLHTPKSS